MNTIAARIARPASGAEARGRKPRLRRGFSLSEILIATGILGVGLIMVMALFPAAIDTSRDSTADVLGEIICENGLNILKTELTPSSLSGVGTAFDAAEGTPPGTGVSLTAKDRAYPSGDANRLRGFMALARRVGSGNDYQFLVVSYLKTTANNQVRAMPLSPSSTLDANAMVVKVPTAQQDLVRLGSPVIDPGRGAYARIVSYSTSGATITIVLDHPVDRSRAGTTIANPLVIVETDSTGTPANVPISPATHVLVARATLRQ